MDADTCFQLTNFIVDTVSLVHGHGFSPSSLPLGGCQESLDLVEDGGEGISPRWCGDSRDEEVVEHWGSFLVVMAPPLDGGGQRANVKPTVHSLHQAPGQMHREIASLDFSRSRSLRLGEGCASQGLLHLLSNENLFCSLEARARRSNLFFWQLISPFVG